MSLWLCCFLPFPACCLPYWRHDSRLGGSFILAGMPSGSLFALKISYAHNPLPLLECCVVAFQLLIVKQQTGIKLSLLLCLYAIYNHTISLPPAASTERKRPWQLSWVSLFRASLPNWTQQATLANDESKQEKQPRYSTQQKRKDFGQILQ